jgi:hypothetical protein
VYTLNDSRLRVKDTLAMFPNKRTNRSEYFTGPANLAGPKLPPLPVETCLDCEQDEYSTGGTPDVLAGEAHIVGWLLCEDKRILLSYADAIEHGRETVLLLSNGTALKVNALRPNGFVHCDPTN